MSGDRFYATRIRLLSIATDQRDPGRAAIALVLGLHLVQDRPAHLGITNILEHIATFFPHKDADPRSALGDLAVEATQKFLEDFKRLLVRDFGEEGAADFLLKMQAASGRLSESAIVSEIGRISEGVEATRSPGGQGPAQSNSQPSSHVQEDMQRQCAQGNPAACD